MGTAEDSWHTREGVLPHLRSASHLTGRSRFSLQAYMVNVVSIVPCIVCVIWKRGEKRKIQFKGSNLQMWTVDDKPSLAGILFWRFKINYWQHVWRLLPIWCTKNNWNVAVTSRLSALAISMAVGSLDRAVGESSHLPPLMDNWHHLTAPKPSFGILKGSRKD